MDNRRFWLNCGIAGVAGTACFALAAAIPWPGAKTGASLYLLFASAWPVFSIVFIYGLYTYIAEERNGAANRIAFILGALAFSAVLAMVIVRLAMGAAFDEIGAEMDDDPSSSISSVLETVYLVLEMAWVLLIGACMIFMGFTIRRHPGFGIRWAAPVIVLGILLPGLSAATFPRPLEADRLFDIGPLVATWMLVLAVRLIVLARREPEEEEFPED